MTTDTSGLHALYPNKWQMHLMRHSGRNMQQAACWVEHVNDGGQRECVIATCTASEGKELVENHEKWRARHEN